MAKDNNNIIEFGENESAGPEKKEVGRVTPEERDEIKALFERKNGIMELTR